MSSDAFAAAHAAIPLALTFDDVLLLPAYSDVLPHTASPATDLGRGVVLPMPLLAAAMDTVTHGPMARAVAERGGLGVVHKNFTPDDQAQAIRFVKETPGPHPDTACCDALGALRVGAAVGVGEAGLARAHVLVAAGVDMLVIDTAHGHTQGVLSTLRALRLAYPELLLAAGNVATPQGVVALAQAGADVVKVGIGPGSICTTRQVSGVGVPQMSAVLACAKAAQACSVTLIADGGVRTSGDIVKALAGGAHAVMLGSLLAGSDEAPGTLIERDGRMWRSYRGMGSLGAMRQGSADRYFQGPTTGSSQKLVPEGVEAAVPATGPVAATLDALVGGLRSGMGYLGAKDLSALRKNAQFVRQSPAGLRESGVHDVAQF